MEPFNAVVSDDTMKVADCWKLASEGSRLLEADYSEGNRLLEADYSGGSRLLEAGYSEGISDFLVSKINLQPASSNQLPSL